MNLKSKIKKTFLFKIYAFFTVKESVDSVFANILGITIFRVLLAEFSRKIQCLFYSKSKNLVAIEELEKNGFTLLNDFFTSEQLEKLKKTIYEELLKIEESKAQDGAQYIVKNIETFKIYNNAELDIMKDKILAVSQPYLGKIDRSTLHIYFHAVKKLDGLSEDNSDINLLMHSDTYHKTLKGFLYLEPLDIEDGPFEYVISSNVLDKKRLKREYMNSINKSVLERDHGGWRFEDEYFKNRNRKLFTGIGNTMIIADTFGLHRRNPRFKDGYRISIHFSLRKSPFTLFGKITG